MGRKYTEAQKNAAEKYLSGFSQFVVRMRPDDLERLDRAAEAAGKSRAAFVQDAVADAIEKQIGVSGQVT